ncbi:hypothetical protein [Bradyrhizobium sp.]|jgi:hypothetical protein|uniref:hypothetical protein n=1 Tax=Bradyrhizobium sp. TaxID=376 RepID=UPI002E03432D|nr:hypothetical protein [Bradyrhizobium sp.]
MTATTVNTATSILPGRKASRWAFRLVWRHIGLFASVAAGTAFAIAAANSYLDPLNFSASGQSVVASQLHQGLNVQVRDPNLDFRGLRREQVRQMDRTPDIIAFAGSRFELASAALFPGQSYFNAFVHSDFIEDLIAFTGLLEANGRLPKTLILSVRFATFLPLSARKDEEWKMFWPEYRAMADKLGISTIPLTDNLPFSHTSQMFSVSLLKRQLAFRFTSDEAPGTTHAASHPKFDVIRSDGSLAFSAAHQGSFTPESARALAIASAKKVANTANWPVDAERVAMLAPLLKYLRDKGVQVAIAITPHHPAYWNALIGTPYGKALASIEAQVSKIAAGQNAVLVGSFDPTKAGCQESNFRDYIHLDEACLHKVFGKIPRA